MATPRSAALLTDFGHSDPFAGIMKGVILSRAPKAVVVDLCHGIAPQDVEGAALALRASVPYFPRNTLFVVVVDPGVGSSRRILWGRSKHHQFLAPDNGVLSWLPEDHAVLERRSVENRRLFLPAVSSTFHGRDIFSPCAGELLSGLSPSKLGPAIKSAVRLPWPSAPRVLSFDRFGNAITSVSSSSVKPGSRVTHRGRDLGPLRTHYAEVPTGRPLAVAGSMGLVELSTRDGDFRASARARKGDPVHVRHRR